MSEDLPTRLLAAIEAKEAKARAGAGYSRGSWARAGKRELHYSNGRSERYEAVFVGNDTLLERWDRIRVARDDGSIAEHIADNDPKSVLAMCSAHRQIVELYAEHADYDRPDDSYEHATGRICGLGEALRLIARGYGIQEDDS